MAIFGLLILAVAATYGNSLRGPFVFDDHLSIVDNPTVHSLAPPWRALSPPAGEGRTVEGRPILNLSLALNYALGGATPSGYRLVNLLIHAANAWLAFLLIRSVAAKVAVRGPPAPTLWMAPAATALIWATHPINSAAVTYVVQRAESLMGFFLLSTLYAFDRAITTTPSVASEAGNAQRWRRLPLGWCFVAVLACGLGMGTKEVMVGAPLLTLFYDRTFVSGSFRRAWINHWPLYAGLALTWFVLVALALGAGDRGGTIGAAAGVTPWEYAFAQSRGIFHYLRLVVWPTPLIFDYGPDIVSFGEAVPYLFALLVLLVVAARALVRGSPLGFPGAVFFVILAPTSSFVGGSRQMLAEHRMYLPSIVVIMLGVLAAQRVLARLKPAVVLAVVAAFAALTIQRNLTYRSELQLYHDTVFKRPGNPFAQYNLGKLLAESGRLDAAIVADREAIRLRPGLVGARLNLANALSESEKWEEAIVEYRAAIELKPDYAAAHYNLGNALVRLNRKPEAAEHFRFAVQAAPQDLNARDNLGTVLMELDRLAEAEAEFQAVLRADPNRAETHYSLGTVYFLQSRNADAARHYEEALRIKPGFPPAREGLARLKP